MSDTSDSQNWHDTAFLELVTIKSGQVDPRVSPYRDLPLIAPDHLASGTGRLIKKVSASAQGAISGKYLVRPGDVIYSKIRPYLQKAYRCDFEALCSADMYPLTPRRGVDSSFILHSLLAHDFTNFAVSVSARSGIPKINREELAEYRMAVPGWAEQRRIGQALDDADSLIVALERLMAKKQAIKHGMRQDLLSGRVRLPGHTAPWTEARLGSLGKAIRGVAYEPDADLSSSDQSFTVRLLRSNNVQDGQIDRRGLQFVHERRVSSAQVLASGDIIICTANGSRALVGKAALFEPKRGEPRYTFGAFMGAFRTDQSVASPRYIAELMRTHVFRNWLDVLLSGSSINNLRPGDIEGFVASLPSLPEQIAIAETLGDVDQEIDQLGERLAKARAIKQGMMQHLLTGRVHLPVEAAE